MDFVGWPLKTAKVSVSFPETVEISRGVLRGSLRPSENRSRNSVINCSNKTKCPALSSACQSNEQATLRAPALHEKILNGFCGLTRSSLFESASRNGHVRVFCATLA